MKKNSMKHLFIVVLLMFFVFPNSILAMQLQLPDGRKSDGATFVTGGYHYGASYVRYQSSDTGHPLYCLSPDGDSGIAQGRKGISPTNFGFAETITVNSGGNKTKFANAVLNNWNNSYNSTACSGSHKSKEYCNHLLVIRCAAQQYLRDSYFKVSNPEFKTKGSAYINNCPNMDSTPKSNTSTSNPSVSVDVKCGSKEMYSCNSYDTSLGQNGIKVTITVRDVNSFQNINSINNNIFEGGKISCSKSGSQIICSGNFNPNNMQTNQNVTLSGTIPISYSYSISGNISINMYTNGGKCGGYSCQRFADVMSISAPSSGTKNDNIRYQFSAKKICQECNTGVVPSTDRVFTSCTNNEQSIKEPDLCSIIPKCGVDTVNSNNYKQSISTSSCKVYCTDEVKYTFFSDKYIYDNYNNLYKGTIMAGRGFVFSVSGPNGGKETAILNITRKCALIPTQGNSCNSNVLDKVISQKPISCDNMISTFDYGQPYNEDVRKMLNSSISSQNSFKTFSYYQNNNTYANYCGSNVCSGEFKGTAVSKGSINYGNAVEVIMNTGDIKIKLNQNFYQKAYSGTIGTTATTGWYKLPDAFYPVSDDTKSSKQDYNINMIYSCLGAGTNTKGKSFSYGCSYTVKNYTTKFTCDNLDSGYTCFYKSTPGDNNPELAFFYRTVDLNKVIPASRTKTDGNQIIGVNWSEALSDGKVKLSASGSLLEANGRTEVSENLWSSTPEYTVIITPEGVGQIRNFNDLQRGNYQNETFVSALSKRTEDDLNCASNGYCTSNGLNELNSYTGVEVSRNAGRTDNIYSKNVYGR